MEKEREDHVTRQIEASFTELQEKGIKELRMENTKYDKLRDDIIKLNQKFMKALRKLSPKDSKDVEKYVDALEEMEYIEKDYLYARGYHDCMKFLRHIRII